MNTIACRYGRVDNVTLKETGKCFASSECKMQEYSVGMKINEPAGIRAC